MKSSPVNREQIRNHASIVFDANEPILTNEHLVTFDLALPVSSVSQLPSTTSEAQFNVSWSGHDSESGIQFYNIYVSVNGGADSLWLARTHLQSALFNGLHGNAYRFYSIAVDNSGNVESTPTLPDAEISILVRTDDLSIHKKILVYPNPAYDQINFYFVEQCYGELTLYRGDGQPVLSSSTKGEALIHFSVANMPDGVYVWKWLSEDGDSMAIGKVILRHQIE
ncbi:MAG: T9SS type A sorting domain-containing protein [Saprospiraceae bacterium]|nr:T9SS type A sorting domain-containing protein [Saprospiraceae bacterium]